MIESVALSNACFGNTFSVLKKIHQPTRNISILQRDISALQTQIKQLVDQEVRFKVKGTVAAIHLSLHSIFNEEFPACSEILEDIKKVLSEFDRVVNASSYRLQMTTIHTDLCRKFHRDINYLRLLCTYFGKGTLWLPTESVNYRAIKEQGSNEEIVINDSHIQQVQTGDIIILKGALYPNSQGVIHKSPAIQERGEKRLMLRIDTNQR